ncbi:MAG: thioredoxin [Paludibacteraceae bacterium]|nr:thioredoxin [Paludibacteraceae bacterium]
MKKLILFTLAILGFIFLYGIINEESNPSSSDAETEEVQVETEQTSQPVVIKELNDDEFKKLVGSPKSNKEWNFVSDKPILVDFYATWCGPCKMMAPNIEKVAQNYAGKLTVYKVDVEKAERTAATFGISSIPTLLFVNPKTGQLSAKSGYQDYSDLKGHIKEALGL